MAATPTVKTVRRAHRVKQRNSTTRRKTQEATAGSEEKEGVVVNVEGVRRARSDFYNTPPQDRVAQDPWFTAHEDLQGRKHSDSSGSRVSPAMARDDREKDREDRKRRSAIRTISADARSTTRPSHSRRKRRSSKERDPQDGGYVYRSSRSNSEGARASPGLRRSSTISSGAQRPSPLPDRVKVLRTLGQQSPARPASQQSLQAPLRSASQRSVRRPRAETDTRRHSYHEASKSGASLSAKARRENGVEGASARPSPTRSISMRETSSKPPSRPPLARSQTSVKKPRHVLTPLSSVPEETKSKSAHKLERSGSVFESLFGAGKPPVPETKVTCLTCLSDDIPLSRSARLACKHRMCYPCLKRIFTMSVTDPAHMPPKCCTSDCIPLKHVDKLFDTKFKVRWNRKYQEYTTKNRIYCPKRGCGAWIPPRDIHLDGASRRKYGKCAGCRTKICATCNGKWHTSKECPNDEATIRFAEIAKEEGWQRCFNCSAMVELKEGCNHMTCRCTAEFCMICGQKWKSCDCPWFNYASVETDRLNRMNIAEVRREPWGANAPRAYHEEIERRREQERRDEALARRMQGLDIDVNLGGARIRRGAENDPAAGAGAGTFAVGNASGHFMNENFVNRATDILAGAYNPAQQAAADVLVAEIRGNHRAVDLAPLDASVTRPEIQRRATTGARRTDPARRMSTVAPGTGGVAERLLQRRTASAAVAGPPKAASAESTPDAARLAGLTSRTATGRVDSWRRYIS